MLAIRQAETPRPISARPAISSGRLCALANSAAPQAATASRLAFTRRGPQRSSSTPSGSWNEAKARK